MKKVLLLTVLLFQLTISFGQKPQWGPWTTMACYKGIQYSVANLGYDKSTNKYWWNVRWKNNYSKAVSFDGQVIINGENSLHGGFGNIQPGGVSTYTSLPYKSNSTNFTVSVNNVCFADRYGGCSATLEGYPNYAECDNGTPNYKVNAKKSSGNPPTNPSTGSKNQNSSTGNIDEQIKTLTKRRNELCLQVVKIDQGTYNNICDSWQGRNQLPTKEQTLAYLKEDIHKLETRLNANGNTTTNTSKNDLTEYNRSKADLERQMAEKNAERQQQANQLASQRQQFVNTYNEGVALGNTGKYNDAAVKYQQAIGLATNETDRQNAQNAYNRITKVANQTQAINQLTSATAEFLKVLNNRKRANKSALSSEDAQVLLGIVNSETPFDYAQNIIDIFSDLGYTYKSTDKLSYGGMYISMFDNSTIQWPLSIVIDPASKYDPYNKIKFSYQRKEKLYNQLLALGDNLSGFSIKGISPTRKKEEEQKNTEKEQKTLVEELKKKEIAAKFAEIIPVKSSKIVDTNVSVESVLKKYIIARGGEEKLKAVESITILTESEKFSMSMTATYGKIISKGTYDGNNFKSVFNGTTGYSEFNGKKTILDNDQVALYKTTQPIEQIFKSQNNNDLKLGEVIENFKGKDCYTITENSKFKYINLINKQFFDIITGLRVGTETISTAPNYNSTSYVYYDDYRSIGGILFPFSMLRIDEKNLTKTITTEIKLNVNIIENDFQ